MKALNYKEKSDAITKFVLIFIITLIIAIVAIYYNMTFKSELSANKEKQIKTYREYRKNEKQITAKFDSLELKIDKLGKSNISAKFESDEILKQIDFEKLANDDSLNIKITARLNRLFIKYLDVKLKYDQLSNDLAEEKGNIGEAATELDDLKSELKDAKDELRDCQAELRAIK